MILAQAVAFGEANVEAVEALQPGNVNAHLTVPQHAQPCLAIFQKLDAKVPTVSSIHYQNIITDVLLQKLAVVGVSRPAQSDHTLNVPQLVPTATLIRK